jgi:hypothetical protein
MTALRRIRRGPWVLSAPAQRRTWRLAAGPRTFNRKPGKALGLAAHLYAFRHAGRWNLRLASSRLTSHEEPSPARSVCRVWSS